MARMDASSSAESVSAAVAQLQQRVERLLLLYAESQRTQALLRERLAQAEAEREQLRQRAQEATARIDSLLRRLDQTDSLPGTADPA